MKTADYIGALRRSGGRLVDAAEGHLDRVVPSCPDWDLAELVSYRHEYLSGFQVEAYAIDLRQGFEEGKLQMDHGLRQAARRKIGGDSQRIDAFESSFSDITFKHILLPLWISAYYHRGELFRILVNARTGEVQGERPWSVLKILGAIGLALFVILIIVLLAR